MASLLEQVQALPPELFLEVQELTFTANSRSLTIDQYHKPSPLLRIDQASRAQFAASFYGRLDTVEFEGHHACSRWLISLPNVHCHLLQNVQLIIILSASCAAPDFFSEDLNLPSYHAGMAAGVAMALVRELIDIAGKVKSAQDLKDQGLELSIRFVLQDASEVTQYAQVSRLMFESRRAAVDEACRFDNGAASLF